jgi:hypothetical protein
LLDVNNFWIYDKQKLQNDENDKISEMPNSDSELFNFEFEEHNRMNVQKKLSIFKLDSINIPPTRSPNVLNLKQEFNFPLPQTQSRTIGLQTSNASKSRIKTPYPHSMLKNFLDRPHSLPTEELSNHRFKVYHVTPDINNIKTFNQKIGDGIDKNVQKIKENHFACGMRTPDLEITEGFQHPQPVSFVLIKPK